MSVTRIKFCGLTRADDAQACIEAGAWALGFIFTPASKRAIDPAEAAAIVRPLRRKARIAGVFVDQPLDEVVAIAELVGLDLVQLHGTEGPSYCSEVHQRTGAQVIKAARVQNRGDVSALQAFRVDVDFHLLDAFVDGEHGGTGETFDHDLAREHRRRTPLILSGGLTPDNVGAAITQVQPFAVDVSSGVETEPGVKDHAKIAAFAEAVRAVAPVEEDAADQSGGDQAPSTPADQPLHADAPAPAGGDAPAVVVEQPAVPQPSEDEDAAEAAVIDELTAGQPGDGTLDDAAELEATPAQLFDIPGAAAGLDDADPLEESDAEPLEELEGAGEWREVGSDEAAAGSDADEQPEDWKRAGDRGPRPAFAEREGRPGYEAPREQRGPRGGGGEREQRGPRGGGGYREREQRGPRGGGGYREREERGPRGGGFRDDRGPRGGDSADEADRARRNQRGFRGRGDTGEAPRDDRGPRGGGGFRERDDRGPRGGGKREWQDRGPRSGGGFRERDDRGPRGGGGFRDDRGPRGGGGGGGYRDREERGPRGGGGGGGYREREERGPRGGGGFRHDRGPRGGGDGGFRERDDRGPRGGGRFRDDRGPRGGGFRDDRGPRGGGFRDDRGPRGGGGSGFRERDDRGPRGGGGGFRDDRGPRGGGGGGFRERDDRGPRGGGGGGFRERDDRGPRGGGGGGFRDRDDRPRGGPRDGGPRNGGPRGKGPGKGGPRKPRSYDDRGRDMKDDR